MIQLAELEIKDKKKKKEMKDASKWSFQTSNAKGIFKGRPHLIY